MNINNSFGGISSVEDCNSQNTDNLIELPNSIDDSDVIYDRQDITDSKIAINSSVVPKRTTVRYGISSKKIEKNADKD